MKKNLISFIFAFLALMMLSGCIVSEQKLTEKIQSAIVEEEQSKGRTLEVTEFSLGEKTGKNYQGVLKGKLDGKEMVYDVTVTDEGDDFDVNWTPRP